MRDPAVADPMASGLSDVEPESTAGRWVCWAPAAAAALPIVVATVLAVAHGWFPVADQAGQVSRIAEVGTRHTPLIGSYSREGWSHPGPLLFWTCAPAWRLFGAAGVLLTVGAVNAVTAALAPVLARKVAGPGFDVAVAAVLLVVEVSIGPAGLVDVWNPYVGTFALVTGLLALAAVVGGVDWALPVAVVAFSWSVQAHVGPTPTVAAAVVTAAVLLVSQRRAPARRWLVVGLAAGFLVWSGPLIDQAAGDGNLGSIVSGLSEPGQPRPSLKTSLDIAAGHLGVVPVWARGGDGIYNHPVPGWTMVVPLAATALVGWSAHRRRDAGLLRMAWITGVGFGAAVVTTTRIDLVVNPYLYRWAWAVAATTWAVIGLGAWRAVRWRWGNSSGRVHAGARPVGIALIAVAVAVAAGGVTADEHVPLQRQSDATEALIDPVRDKLGRDEAYAIVVRGGLDWGAVATGLGVDLVNDGYDVAFDPTFRRQLGAHHIAGDETRRRIEVLATTTIEDGPPSPGGMLLATYDPLTTSERDRVADLEDAIREQVGDALAPEESVNVHGFGGDALLIAGADRATVEALNDLISRGYRYTVWLDA